MERIRLIHWKAAEAEERALELRSLGFEVDSRPVTSGTIRELPHDAVSAFVVDLTRLPSQGRDVAVAVRRAKSSRHVPIVFVGGTADKVARTRELLPDATYTSWEEISEALSGAIDSPPRDPVVPSSGLAAYSSTPLPQKLGIKEGSVICLVGAPEDFELEAPASATVRRSGRGRRDLTIVFVHTPAEAERRWKRLAADPKVNDVWVVWAKKASPLYSGVTQANVRGPGMARGFVDFKVAAIDETWSGLRFKRRK